MESRLLDSWEPGWVLARPARLGTGQPLAPAGTPLSRELNTRLQRQGLAAIQAVRAGEPLPEPPEHLDRYGDDAEQRLAAVFAGTQGETLMQRLLEASVDHARACRTAYRATTAPAPARRTPA